MIESHLTVALLRTRKRNPRPKIKDLTLAEWETLRALDQAIRQHGNPTLKEIAACSKTVRWVPMVHEYLRRLRDKGYVSLGEPRRSRGIRMLRELPQRTA